MSVNSDISDSETYSDLVCPSDSDSDLISSSASVVHFSDSVGLSPMNSSAVNFVQQECVKYGRSNHELIALYEAVKATGTYNYKAARLPLKSNLNISFWKKELAGYSDNILLEFLEFGWPVNYVRLLQPVSCSRNHPSAYEFPSAIQSYIDTELGHNALAGPFVHKPLDLLSISPLHTVPKDKKAVANSRRVVLDLSFPPNQSVNDGIPRNAYLDEDLHLQYPTVDALIQLLVKYNSVNGPWMLKRDLSRAYRQLRIDPYDFDKLGFKWDNKFFFDIALPFGLRTAAQACQRTSSGLAYMLKKRNVDIVNYVDDIAAVASSRDDIVRIERVIDDVVLQLVSNWQSTNPSMKRKQ